MLEKKNSSLGGIRLLLRAIVVWFLTAGILLLAASAVLAHAGTGSEVLGYISSAISFLCALAAGASVRSKGGDSSLILGGLTALVLIILLLTAGFLVRGEGMNSSGILSVVSFTAAGCILGTVLLGKRLRRQRSGSRTRGRKGQKRFT